jgi:hypothetical protein
MSKLEIFYYTAGVLGFFLSLINTIWLICQNRVNCSVLFDKVIVDNEVNNYKGKTHNVIFIRFLFVNHSKKPISITRIRIKVNHKFYDVHTLSHLAEYHKLKENQETFFQDINSSVKLPVNLSGYEAQSGFLAFLVPQGNLTGDEEDLTFQIYTSHCKSAEKTLKFGVEYQVQRLQ